MENVQEFVNNQNSVAAEKNETTSSTKTSFLKKLLGRNDVGTARFFKNQTYHHAVLRALSQVATHGADISEVLQAMTKMQAGDEQNWFAEWTALGERFRPTATAHRWHSLPATNSVAVKTVGPIGNGGARCAPASQKKRRLRFSGFKQRHEVDSVLLRGAQARS